MQKLEFDLLILDIDGVLTDGTKVYDINGNVISKRFNDRDFTAIKRFKDVGVHVCFLSGDKKFNESMAKKRKIDFFYGRDKDGNMDKKNVLNTIKKKYNASRIAYVGDDYYDLEVLERVDHSFCPYDSIIDVKNACDYVLESCGSCGVVAEIFDIFVKNKTK